VVKRRVKMREASGQKPMNQFVLLATFSRRYSVISHVLDLLGDIVSFLAFYVVVGSIPTVGAN
jgi:hypothetical protein